MTATLLLLRPASRRRSPRARVAEGRYHLRKANGLAGDDRCQAAIHEYTLAFKKLRDPVVLFNRAECYRRIGEGEKAVADYRAFLEAVPAAPNRAQIEVKIAALSRRLTPSRRPSLLPAPIRPGGRGPIGRARLRPRARAPRRLRRVGRAAAMLDDAPLAASAASPPTVALVQTAPATRLRPTAKATTARPGSGSPSVPRSRGGRWAPTSHCARPRRHRPSPTSGTTSSDAVRPPSCLGSGRRCRGLDRVRRLSPRRFDPARGGGGQSVALARVAERDGRARAGEERSFRSHRRTAPPSPSPPASASRWPPT